ncbi:MAG: acyl-CoA synthetase FdrA [Desulfovibrio sp.]|jgi:FdrA protein|nr:acyl-CoA synthetase FdrA [Desulfovibrio sp.]
MHIQAAVHKNRYQDSVRLMQISRQAGELPGVHKVLALLGTDSNKKVLSDLGLLDAEIAAATANDLVVCVEADSPEAAQAAFAEVDLRLRSGTVETQAGQEKPKSLEDAVGRLPGANFAMISLPGQFAKLDVISALEQNLNVMLFSDNISLEDELDLKKIAVKKKLLLMGPDCGTAIVNGVALALANIVRRGDIGIAAASGTGIQEVSCLIDRFGGGVSHAIGVGGRDLRAEIGGTMMCHAIRTLAEDPGTKRLILLSKPGAPAVMDKVLNTARETGLEVVACLLGAGEKSLPGMTLAPTLEEAAFTAMGQKVPELKIAPALRERAKKLAPERRYLRGLFSGGTLCYEALYILRDSLEVESNVALKPELKLHYPAKGSAHYCMDLGEDEFTVGRPHPIIDLSLRLEWLAENLTVPTVKVVLLDLVLGYGANRDPASDLLAGLAKIWKKPADGGPLILAHVCGTDNDPQKLAVQEEMLDKAGIFLFPTNAQAARAALTLVRGQF